MIFRALLLLSLVCSFLCLEPEELFRHVERFNHANGYKRPLSFSVQNSTCTPPEVAEIVADVAIGHAHFCAALSTSAEYVAIKEAIFSNDPFLAVPSPLGIERDVVSPTLQLYATISESSLRHNALMITDYIRTISPHSILRLRAVVKSNAYGHGLLPSARLLLSAGADGLAVADLSEAASLREAGISAPIVILYPIPAAAANVAAAMAVEPTAAAEEDLLALDAVLRRPLRVHFALDTGCARAAAQFDTANFTLPSLRFVRIAGVSTHLCNPSDPVSNSKQLRVLATLRPRLPATASVAAGGSAALLSARVAPRGVDALNVGGLFFGILPPPLASVAPRVSLPVVRAFALYARVSWVGRNRATCASYGCQVSARRGDVFAMLSVGSAHGVANLKKVMFSCQWDAGIVAIDANVATVNITDAKSEVKVGDVALLSGCCAPSRCLSDVRPADVVASVPRLLVP